MQLVHLASRLYGTPLLIARAKLDVILAVLGPRIGLQGLDMAAPLPGARSETPTSPGIAVIPIHGTLVRRALGLEVASGLSSYAEIGARIDAALDDPAVKGILLDIDSPGGEAGGVFELADRIRLASAIKPVWAHANDAAFSAAYALAASATRLTLSQTAGVGSIGVIALHVDQSVKDAKDGLTYTAIYAGQHKNDFSPHAPLSEEAGAALQLEVDRLYEIFVSQVAGMRGLEPEAIRSLEARLVFGAAAVTAGLADGVASLEQVVAEFAASLAAQRRLGIASSAHRTPPARASPVAAEAPPVPLSSPSNPESPMEQLSPTATAETPPTAPAPLAAEPLTPNPRAEAQAIAEICLIAGASQRTAEFLAAGLSEAQVRRALLEARADQPEIASRITADAGTALRPETSPVVAAVKKLITKE
jgi:signal peptide peptidase SppA